MLELTQLFACQSIFQIVVYLPCPRIHMYLQTRYKFTINTYKSIAYDAIIIEWE
jgi:hypothetical protein